MPVASFDTSATSSSDTHYQFLVGQDEEGHWLAVETHGLGGGLFVTRDAALHYAMSETSKRPGAISIAPDPIRLR